MNDRNPYSSPEAAAGPAPKEGETTAPSPSCGHTVAMRIKWTMWGGALGPNLFNHVKCLTCGATFNAAKGTSTAFGITIDLTVSLMLGIVAGVMLAQMLAL